jgi:hypothetical protein
MTENQDTPAYLEELASTLASHGSNLAALRMAELEKKVSPVPPGVPSASAGEGGTLAGLGTAYSTSVAMGAAGLFITDGALTVANPGSTVIIDGTSNMFKIAATGTISATWPGAHSAAGGAATLTALGAMTAPLAMVSMVQDPSYSGGYGRGAADVFQLNYYGQVDYWAQVRYVYLGVGWPCQVSLLLWTYGASPWAGTTTSGRYYILREAGV